MEITYNIQYLRVNSLVYITFFGTRKNGPRKMVRGKNGPRKNGSRKNGPREKWSPENWSPEKCPSKIVLRQKNDRKFERLFHLYQLIPLHTQKDV